MFLKLLFANLLLVSLSACSVYKSPSRQEFENKSPSQVSASALQKQLHNTPLECRKISFFPAWIEREFPDGQAELLSSDSDFEAWKIVLNNGKTIFRTYQNVDGGYEVCTSLEQR